MSKTSLSRITFVETDEDDDKRRIKCSHGRHHKKHNYRVPQRLSAICPTSVHTHTRSKHHDIGRDELTGQADSPPPRHPPSHRGLTHHHSLGLIIRVVDSVSWYLCGDMYVRLDKGLQIRRFVNTICRHNQCNHDS